MVSTRLTDIYDYLKSLGIDVYFTGQHKGDVKIGEQYVVIRDAGGTQVGSYTSTVSYVELLCYVSIERRQDMEVFKERIQKIMRKPPMWPMFKDTYQVQPEFIDDEIKAVMVTLEFQYHRKIESSI